VRRILIVLPLVLAACADKGYALSDLCDGRVPAGRAVVLSATFAYERYPVESIERLQILDDNGHPSAFVGAALVGANQIEVYGPTVSRGWLKMWVRAEPSDTEADEVSFRLLIDDAAPMTPSDQCRYTNATGGP
jgi:hypothetical protein